MAFCQTRTGWVLDLKLNGEYKLARRRKILGIQQKAAEKRVQCVLSDRIVLRTEQLISPQQVNGRINRKAKSKKATSSGAYVVNY